MKIETVSIDDIHADPANVRQHPEKNLAAIKASLARFGQQKPIVVDASGIVRAGNGTLEAARSLGWETINVIRTPLQGSEATAYAIADNRTGELAEWDETGLAEQLRALQSEDFDLAAVGYDEAEVDAMLERLGSEMLGEPAEDPGPQIDKAEELLKKWRVKTGDLWIIPSKATPGKEHRLLCGDSTKAGDVARVMGGEKACVMATDPPYGVDFSGAKYNPRAKEWDGIDNDELQGNDLEAFILAVLGAWLPSVADDAGFYFWTAAMQEGAAAAAAVRKAGLHIQSQIIWVKNCLVLGQADYHWRHENCWYAFWKGKKHRWYGERDKTTVWEVDKLANSAYMHPMQKPTELYAIPMRHHTLAGEIVAEPFAGSGSQFVAAEQTGRLCRGIEIAPKYCAVILERLAGIGLTPSLSAAT